MMNPWDKFFNERSKPLWEKFPGLYRAEVVETNDPLNMGRIRFRCPDMHDSSLPAVDCPWAVPCMDLGGRRAGRFTTPVIGDLIWIAFERQHPYGPIWMGFAPATRRKYYSYPQVTNQSPTPVNDNGGIIRKPEDFDLDYLPKDGRPMSHGWVDRYGNIDIHSSVGYFPVEHTLRPPPPDHDALSGTAFTQASAFPQINNPDKKYMARITKYGHIFLMGDQGYHWRKEEGEEGKPDIGEFIGDAEADERFETKRWLFLQKLLNDNVPRARDKDGDQRKILLMSRYGTRLEIRDAGWAQAGPIQSTSRSGEFGPGVQLSKETNTDYRWFKIRTKGGMLFQAYDKGFHPGEDRYIKRPLIQESGSKSELEDKHWGGRKDARWVRLYTRYGLKFVMDDRGSDERSAETREDPRGVGILIKGRRTPSAKAVSRTGDPRGFTWEFNENDEANHSTWSSPLGQAVEINDRYQYTMIAVSMGKGWVPKHLGLKQNEFIRKPLMLRNPEKNAHHLKLDHDNEYIRLKTRGGRGTKPRMPANRTGVGKREIQQGFEARDGRSGDGPWVELVDCQRRGLWFSKQNQLGIWRSKKGRKMYQWFDDRQRAIVIYNNENAGTIDIYANRAVNIISNNNLNLQAGGNISIKAGRNIRMQAGDSLFTLQDGNNIRTNANLNAPQVNAFLSGAFPGPGAGRRRTGGISVPETEAPTVPEFLEPTDRGQTYNGPFEECPREEVEHEIRE
jgi:hypothetical protein